mmetsp:Transcript_4167/g.5770  ORF Transcript_4167/g.5770 Transcript_4167/m.5770 type:complete len:91 (-) Transcript_4167:849-1121(-)
MKFQSHFAAIQNNILCTKGLPFTPSSKVFSCLKQNHAFWRMESIILVTYCPIAGEDVKPGDSIPTKLMKFGSPFLDSCCIIQSLRGSPLF